MSERRAATYAIDTETGARLPHYVAAMILVGGLFVGAGRAVDREASVEPPSETQDAVVIDLPPVEAGAHPQGDDAPTRQVAPAASGAEMPPRKPETAEPPKPAIIEIAKIAPPRISAPASAAREAHEVGGPQTAPAASADADDTETRRASAHVITLWQKALMARLQGARHGLPHHEHLLGLVEVAFAIDRDGHLVSERVARGSGSASADASALALVRLAAPYPIPPRDAGAAQLSFVVPISFKP